MSARAAWKGALQLRLVQVPIKLYPATESSEALTFNQLHEECKTRIQQRRWCPACAREVQTSEIVKGFEFKTGQYVILQPEELDAVAPPSTKVIDLVQVADVRELDPLHIDRSYVLAPDGLPAAAAYAVIRDALAGQVAIGTLAMYGREFLVAVRVRGSDTKAPGVLLLHTLHHAAEVRSLDPIEDLALVPDRAPAEDVTLARQVLKAFAGPLDLADFPDQYRKDLWRLITAKIKGEEIVVASVVDRAPIVNFRDALRESLAAVTRDRRSSRSDSRR